MRAWLVVLAAVLAGALALGLTTPADTARPTAALGPEPGQPVTEYLDEARAGLATADGARWALLTLDPPADPAAVADLLSGRVVPGVRVSGVRVSEVLLQVPLPRVQTPLRTVAMADQGDRRAGLLAAWARAAGTLSPGPDRAGRVAAYSATRLRTGCACAVGLLLHARADVLRALGEADGVRAVQAAPAGVGYGGLSVRPLLPTHTVTVTPGPDDGPVP